MHQRSFEHEALFYAGDKEFLAGTLPFIREAVAAGERIMVAVDGEKIDLLASHLDGEADQVLFADMRELGRNPALIIPAWRDFVAESTMRGQGCRGIGEPIWPGRSSAEITECQHHEALLNLAFDGSPAWRLLCPYDASALPQEVLAGAERSHPAIAEDGWRRASSAYRDPLAAGAPFEGELPEPPTEAAEMEFAAPNDVEPVRRFVAEQARAEGVDRENADGFVLAVDEVVTNALRHGLSEGLARVWREDGRVICEVTGGGTIRDPLVGRIRPGLDRLGGRGLWIANHFCDLVQIRSSGAGTVVRCHVRIA